MRRLAWTFATRIGDKAQIKNSDQMKKQILYMRHHDNELFNSLFTPVAASYRAMQGQEWLIKRVRVVVRQNTLCLRFQTLQSTILKRMN